MTEWEPATEAEAAMRDALRANDQERYFRILARTELLLPVSANALAGHAPMGWGTWTTGGRTHVLAFTSVNALRACLGENAGSTRRTPYHELAGNWPNLEWWLAVNPGLPVEGYLPAWFVSQLARGDVRLPGRTIGARARLERADSAARARATAVVPGRPPHEQATEALPAAPDPQSALPVRQPAAEAPTGANGGLPGLRPDPGYGGFAPGSAYDSTGGTGAGHGSVAPGNGRGASAPEGRPDFFTAAPRQPRVPPAALAAPPPAAAAVTQELSGWYAAAAKSTGQAHAPDPGTTMLPAITPVAGPFAEAEATMALPPPPTAPIDFEPAPAEPPTFAHPLPTRPVPAESPVEPMPTQYAPTESTFGDLPPVDPAFADFAPIDDPTTDYAPVESAAPSADYAPAVADYSPAVADYSPTEPATGEYALVTEQAADSDYSSVAAPYSDVVPVEPEPVTPTPALPPDFTPANEVEESLLNAAGDGSTDTFLSTLLLARVLLPVSAAAVPGSRPGDEGFVWNTERMDGETYVVVFTSPERIADHLVIPIDTVSVKFVQVIRRWPDKEWSFAVNPGTPVGAKLPGSQIVALANWAAEVGLGDDTGAIEPTASPVEETPRSTYAPAQEDPGRPTMMQKTIAPSQVIYYLERGYDRVSGFVHRAPEVAHLNTPAKLHAALGLGYAGSPFARDADEIYVLRWPAYRPSLYRIPYGGQSESAMRAMEGWVIERPPFRGNGFAPGESSDVVAEFKVDSARLPHGAELWRLGSDGSETLVATFDSDAPSWQQVEAP
ncbi:SseB family protein [Micromonospora sp. NBC_01699]|uniref:SseB family protein n=1 Tax=Micromonospora sp. NBC_01699 TaxID=2975984 RepID=UPI002E2926B4|nr:SseB family protein [Micromonospora sp. NBC_01699]